jgi:thiol-disulfide isomerase/thioredoxin
MENLAFSTREEFEKWFASETLRSKIIIKFTAGWCGPCKTIQPFFEECVNTTIRNCFPVRVIQLDIDINFDVYSYFKRRKLVPGIPCILLYNRGSKNAAFPDEICLGANNTEIKYIFEKAAQA